MWALGVSRTPDPPVGAAGLGPLPAAVRRTLGGAVGRCRLGVGVGAWLGAGVGVGVWFWGDPKRVAGCTSLCC